MPRGVPRLLAVQTTHASLDVLTESFSRNLKAANKSPATIKSYRDAIMTLASYLRAKHLPVSIVALDRQVLEGYLSDQIATRSAATAATRYRGLAAFFRWCVAEEEIVVSPLERIKEPAKTITPPDVLTEDQLRALLRACEGKDFNARRDAAIIRLFVDTGMRRGELGGIRLKDLDMSRNDVVVLGKGRRVRHVPFGAKTTAALDRYLRLRSMHRAAALPALWLGQDEVFTVDGISHMLNRRAAAAGIGHVHPHQFRHTFASMWLGSGGQEQDLMQLGGWRSRTIMARYGAATAASRAHDAHRRLGPGDRV